MKKIIACNYLNINFKYSFQGKKYKNLLKSMKNLYKFSREKILQPFI